MTQKENRGLYLLIGVLVLFVLFLISVPVFSGAWTYEEIRFYTPFEPITEDAVIIKLTEEDYEKYPMLRNIPESFSIDSSPFSDVFIRFGCVDKETGYAIWETYGHSVPYGNKNTYIEHNGVIYELHMPVA